MATESVIQNVLGPQMMCVCVCGGGGGGGGGDSKRIQNRRKIKHYNNASLRDGQTQF